jgi:hypothetical protein
VNRDLEFFFHGGEGTSIGGETFTHLPQVLFTLSQKNWIENRVDTHHRVVDLQRVDEKPLQGGNRRNPRSHSDRQHMCDAEQARGKEHQAQAAHVFNDLAN